jgi:Ca-activated chloride channel family protein
MLDAIYLAISQLQSARYERKAIVIFSDGGDNASQYTLREVRSLVQESDVQIYAIGLFDTFLRSPLEAKLGKKWLSGITDTTGGRTITVDNKTKLPEAACAISRELRNQYVLGYQPNGASAGRWRKIRLRLTQPAAERRFHKNYKRGYIGGGKAQAQNRDPL